jgi:DNA repair protein RadC
MTSDFLKGHRKRLKERYLKNGISSLADYEIIELVLTYSIPRRDVKNLAKELIKKFGSFNNILDTDIDKLKEAKIVTENSAILIKLVKDIIVKYFENSITEYISLSSPEKVNEYINSNKDLLLYLKSKLGSMDKEYFLVLYLNSSNNIIHKEVFIGTVNQAQIYPREIIKLALLKNSVSIILVHNHPSGNPNPSNDDLKLTKYLEEIASNFDIKIHDHIIVSKNKSFSIKANRLIL